MPGTGACHSAAREPLRQRASWLIAQPEPRRFDQQGAHSAVTLFANAMVHLTLAAVVRLRRHATYVPTCRRL
jgi:hypothetical protein